MAKLFVGNLSFKTREPDLAKFFETIGPVKSTNIIARGPRSLGYGFVEFEREEDAQRAVTELNKKELDGRPINVEIAKPREAGFFPAGGAAAPARPRRPRRAPIPAAGAAAPAAAPAGGAAPAPAEQRPRRPRAPRAAAPAAGAAAPAAAPAAPAAGGYAPRRPRGPRRPREPAVAAGAEPSKTTLFVANLPFIVDDEGLLEIFEGMNVKEAHVVCRPNGRSKGYGFVTFDNETDCRRALEAVDKSIVEGRDITVRPAMAPFRKTDVSAPAAAAAAPAAAATAPATTAAAPAPATAAAPAPEAKPEAPAAAQ